MSGNGAYYGKPIVKPPSWTPLIPVYFWSGGLSGALATLALVQRVKRNRALARTAIAGAAAGSALSAFCLIADLKKPMRFLNMLRVFKPTSPMSVGVYIFSVFGGAATAAAVSEFTGIARPLGRLFETVAGLTGPAMSVYTAVLIGDTVMPAWHHGRRSLPAVFAATSLATAGGFAMLFTDPASAKPARRLALVGSLALPLAFERLQGELGTVQRQAYERGNARRLAHAARLLNLSGLLCTLLARRRAAAIAAGTLLLAGGLAERLSIFEAGKISAKDPHFTVCHGEPQCHGELVEP